jgi:hypothetical protein
LPFFYPQTWPVRGFGTFLNYHSCHFYLHNSCAVIDLQIFLPAFKIGLLMGKHFSLPSSISAVFDQNAHVTFCHFLLGSDDSF